MYKRQSINEIRGRENLQRIEQGDDYLQPLNMVPVGTEPSDANGEEPDAEAQRHGETQRTASDQCSVSSGQWLGPVVEDVARRMARREANDLRREGVKAAQRGEFEKWAVTAYAGLEEATRAALGPVAAAGAAAGLGDAGRLHEAMGEAARPARPTPPPNTPLSA